MALIEANGAVVSKDDLISRVWPCRIIEEGNLRAQINALRAATNSNIRRGHGWVRLASSWRPVTRHRRSAVQFQQETSFLRKMC